MPYVDSTNVRDFIGKKVDCERRMFNYYPLTFREIQGKFYYVDRNHVMIPLDERKRIYYDFIVEGYTMDFERFEKLARTDHTILLTALEMLLEKGRLMVKYQDIYGLTKGYASDLGKIYSAEKLHEIVSICKELADLETNALVDYIHRSNLETSDPDADKEGICPICGGELEYGDDEPLDDGGVYEWTCPGCGATGKEGYDKVFDKHYDVQDGDGNPYPPSPQ